MLEIYLDTETIDLPENREGDVMCQLAYLVYNVERKVFTEDYCKYFLPSGYKEMTPMAMARTKLTPEFLERNFIDNDEQEFHDIKTLLENTDNVLYIHNAEFDLEVLKRAGIEVKCKVICTMRLMKFINDRTSLPYESIALDYLHYYTKNYLKVDDLDISVKNFNAHDALYDCVCLFLLKQWLSDNFNMKEEIAINITKNPMNLVHCSFGKNRGMKWSDMTHNQLKYFYDLGDKDICFTIDNLR